MQKQHEQPTTAPQHEVIASAPRQPWQRPTLQRLHVSLDTALDPGSGADGTGKEDRP